MDKKTNVFEADFTEQIKASLTTTCDNCGKKLGESWPRGKDTMQATLKMGEDQDGYPMMKNHHFCNEDCMREHLNQRAGKKGK